MHEHKVTFTPSGKSVYVLPGTTLLEAAARAGIILQTPCGGSGTCGKCRVRVTGGTCTPGAAETRVFGPGGVASGARLACQAKVEEDLVVDVPAESLFIHEHQILTTATAVDVPLEPSVRKQMFTLRCPDRDSKESDLVRLQKVIGDVSVSYATTVMIPRFLRANAWAGTAVISNRHLIALEENDTRGQVYGVAFDIGTTTIAGILVDLTTGVDLATAACVNPQIPYGDDVLSRIQTVRQNPGQLADLQYAAVTALNQLIQRLTDSVGVPRTRVYEAVVAGNTTMQQIFCGYTPAALGEVPFVPVFESLHRVHAAHLGVQINPAADIAVFGQVGGFVGGDTVACMVASRIDQWREPVLLIDIGTNGEIVLAHDGAILATSTAAGPALEGARIGQGMRAATGAIEKVIVDGDVRCNVVGNTAPLGICGSGLIDAVAEMRKAGVLDVMGRIRSAGELPQAAPARLRERVVAHGDGTFDFVLVTADHSGLDEPIVMTQRDIREMQLATGAMRAGVNILLKRAGITCDQLGAVLLAGAFGNFIRRSSALTVGLLPAVPPAKIRSIGNAALMGARMALLSLGERAYAERLRQKTTHVDLSCDRDFVDEFAMAMVFPGE